MQEPPEAIVRNVREHICYLEDSIHGNSEKEIEEHIDDDPCMREDIELLRSIPGIEMDISYLAGRIRRIEQLPERYGSCLVRSIAPSEHTSGTSVFKI